MVFSLIQRIDLVEKEGSGINRMQDNMQEASLPDPVFSMDDFFTVTLYRSLDFEAG